VFVRLKTIKQNPRLKSPHELSDDIWKVNPLSNSPVQLFPTCSIGDKCGLYDGKAKYWTLFWARKSWQTQPIWGLALSWYNIRLHWWMKSRHVTAANLSRITTTGVFTPYNIPIHTLTDPPNISGSSLTNKVVDRCLITDLTCEQFRGTKLLQKCFEV
jgi:hypothetical protein